MKNTIMKSWKLFILLLYVFIILYADRIFSTSFLGQVRFYSYFLEPWLIPFFFFFNNLFIYFWLCWVFVAVHGFSLLTVHGCYSLVLCSLLIGVAPPVLEHRLQSEGSEAVVHGLSCPMACGIFLDQGLNLYPLQWLADSQLLDH